MIVVRGRSREEPPGLWLVRYERCLRYEADVGSCNLRRVPKTAQLMPTRFIGTTPCPPLLGPVARSTVSDIGLIWFTNTISTHRTPVFWPSRVAMFIERLIALKVE